MLSTAANAKPATNNTTKITTNDAVATTPEINMMISPSIIALVHQWKNSAFRSRLRVLPWRIFDLYQMSSSGSG
jgi:hypothetical protein